MDETASNAYSHVAALIARATLGLYFVAAGVAKVEGELSNKIGHFYESSFSALQPAWLPEIVAAPYGYALPWVEVVVGAMLTLGLATRLSAILIALMLASFTVALVLAKGPSGGGPVAFHSNVVLIGLALLLISVGGGGISIDALFRGKKAKVEA